MKIVLSGISATPYAREYLSNAARTLRERGHEVFVPHEGTWTAPTNPADADRFDFEATYGALRTADLLIAVLDGYTVDDGVAAQIGVFYTQNREHSLTRRVIGVLHDTRVAGWDWAGGDRALNPQLREMIHTHGAVYPNFKQAMNALETIQQGG